MRPTCHSGRGQREGPMAGAHAGGWEAAGETSGTGWRRVSCHLEGSRREPSPEVAGPPDVPPAGGRQPQEGDWHDGEGLGPGAQRAVGVSHEAMSSESKSKEGEGRLSLWMKMCQGESWNLKTVGEQGDPVRCGYQGVGPRCQWRKQRTCPRLKERRSYSIKFGST